MDWKVWGNFPSLMSALTFSLGTRALIMKRINLLLSSAFGHQWDGFIVATSR
jgi:hypothetical protein